ncbi:hypothetical protein, partial [Mesorhizobium sp. M1A.T.Ca.IN.004.03.1.1]|uniref:hypothetical protein n=1 Tax=Mesorhizobium sp. M1A.T.Ca.IN.004.03.1.1 TaxID=2496795 RepID=UPI0019CF668F
SVLDDNARVFYGPIAQVRPDDRLDATQRSAAGPCEWHKARGNLLGREGAERPFDDIDHMPYPFL